MSISSWALLPSSHENNRSSTWHLGFRGHRIVELVRSRCFDRSYPLCSASKEEEHRQIQDANRERGEEVQHRISPEDRAGRGAVNPRLAGLVDTDAADEKSYERH